jgi:hypothetical protein
VVWLKVGVLGKWGLGHLSKGCSFILAKGEPLQMLEQGDAIEPGEDDPVC